MSLYSTYNQRAVGVDDQAFDLALRLKELFPAHPNAHNCITELKGSEKAAPMVRCAASIKEYSTHLSPAARAGVGALGMYPGERITFANKVWWSTSFLVLDFDANKLRELTPFIDTFVGAGVHMYATTGTTGRGAHIYIFLSPLLHQKRAHAAVKLLQTAAHDAGLGSPEIRPSSMSGIGSPIFLPYRAADEDGFGVNPLLDPEDNCCPIHLADVHRRVKRVCPKVLEVLC